MPARPGKTAPSKPRESDWIGKQLHQVYGEALSEPIPAELMALIEKIGDKESGSRG